MKKSMFFSRVNWLIDPGFSKALCFFFNTRQVPLDNPSSFKLIGRPPFRSLSSSVSRSSSHGVTLSYDFSSYFLFPSHPSGLPLPLFHFPIKIAFSGAVAVVEFVRIFPANEKYLLFLSKTFSIPVSYRQ